DRRVVDPVAEFCGTGGVQRREIRGGTAADKKSAGSFRKSAEAPEPIDHGQLDGRRAGSAKPGAVEDVETRGKRVRHCADEISGTRNESKKARMVDMQVIWKDLFLEKEVFPNNLHVDHPRFFAFVPGPGNFVSTMADALASGFNIFNGTWLGGSGAAAIELTVIDWFRRFCGFPETAGGLFVSGGSAANLTALHAARATKLGDRIDNATIYFSDQTHYSVERALRVIGFAREQFRKIPSDDRFRLPLDRLREAIQSDKQAGL